MLEAGQDLGIRPCGLGARDTLRTEMGYPLHGHELSLDITPVQARAGLGGGLEEAGVLGARARCWPRRRPARARLLWGLRATGRGIPRPGMAVLDAAGARGRRGHQRHVLADAADRDRPGAARHRRRGGRGRRGRRRRPWPPAGGRGRQAAVRRRRTCASDSAQFLRSGRCRPSRAPGSRAACRPSARRGRPSAAGRRSVVSCAGLVLGLGVDLRAQQHQVAGQVEPQHQHDDAGDGAVGLVVGPEVVHVEAKPTLTAAQITVTTTEPRLTQLKRGASRSGATR